jgi:hypothetical protein
MPMTGASLMQAHLHTTIAQAQASNEFMIQAKGNTSAHVTQMPPYLIVKNTGQYKVVVDATYRKILLFALLEHYM